LIGGEWDEDDSICLICVSKSDDRAEGNDGPTKRKVTSFLDYPEKEAPYECFEYTSQPKEISGGDQARKKTKSELKGTTRIMLPFYGGRFAITYVRTLQKRNDELSGFRALERLQIELARSKEIDLEVPIQCSSTFKRPSALNVQNHSFLLPKVEDLKNIQTLQVTFVMQTLPATNSFQYLNRISVWLLQKPSNDKSLLSYRHDELNVEIVVEADNVSVCGMFEYLQLSY
jgi:hypothetical protein